MRKALFYGHSFVRMICFGFLCVSGKRAGFIPQKRRKCHACRIYGMNKKLAKTEGFKATDRKRRKFFVFLINTFTGKARIIDQITKQKRKEEMKRIVSFSGKPESVWTEFFLG